MTLTSFGTPAVETADLRERALVDLANLLLARGLSRRRELALLLASVGIYGVVAFAVAQPGSESVEFLAE